ncbi:hypothetical protein [Mycoplasmopsis gallinacea]|uniref:Uncharacterized protein n=1 Tax=Mycoplasmopsis gallinacea TaxID=29556 RepID=A0A6H0V4E2_9BACT|nr:hypothetical protein [Mycoplasmopsis gallinacea]QIW62569.1 hypothetical protein GOQ20_04095 [Mycoplasmopsis gallinacea]
MNTVDIEKIKLLAEDLLESKKEVSELNKLLKQEFKDIEIEVDEPLSNGGRITYKKSEPRTTFDFKGYSAFLHNAIKEGKNYTEEELDLIMKEFAVEKEGKWSIKLKK